MHTTVNDTLPPLMQEANDLTRAHRLHETSRFVRVDGRWFYTDGDIHAV